MDAAHKLSLGEMFFAHSKRPCLRLYLYICAIHVFVCVLERVTFLQVEIPEIPF